MYSSCVLYTSFHLSSSKVYEEEKLYVLELTLIRSIGYYYEKIDSIILFYVVRHVDQFNKKWVKLEIFIQKGYPSDK